MIALERLQLFKDMITKLAICQIILISKEMIALYVGKQQVPDAYPKTIQ